MSATDGRFIKEFKSIAPAIGWYRVATGFSSGIEIGKGKYYQLEIIAAFAVASVYQRSDSPLETATLIEEMIVGVSGMCISIGGNEYDDYIGNIAGIVHESQTEIDPASGNRRLKPGVSDTLHWE